MYIIIGLINNIIIILFDVLTATIYHINFFNY
jgi:hypothetical protein